MARLWVDVLLSHVYLVILCGMFRFYWLLVCCWLGTKRNSGEKNQQQQIENLHWIQFQLFVRMFSSDKLSHFSVCVCVFVRSKVSMAFFTVSVSLRLSLFFLSLSYSVDICHQHIKQSEWLNIPKCLII